MIVAVFAAAPEGRTQDSFKDLQRSQQIQQKASGLAGAEAMPAVPALPAPMPASASAPQTQASPAAAIPAPASLSRPTAPITQQSSLPVAEPFKATELPPGASLEDNPFRPKISVPAYEAQYRAAMRQRQSEQAKKKSLIKSISDEIVHYGLYFLLGIVVFLLIYALRKEPGRPTPKTIPSPSPQGEDKNDIWKDDLIT